MNFRFTVVEAALNRAEFKWKALRLLTQTCVLGILACAALLAFAYASVSGRIADREHGLTLLIGAGAVTVLAWSVLILRVLAGSADRRWLAASVERADRRLLDRLNTLLFLEPRRGDARAESFAFRIARQTQLVLGDRPGPGPFAWGRTLSWLAAFLAFLTGTVAVFEVSSPWGRLPARRKGAHPAPVAEQNRLEIAPPPTNSVEQERPWGEVRITDPGADLRVTKVDVVPLQIEAAVNRNLKSVEWRSALNGAPEATHALPAPSEPRYAVYRPVVYLDELGLSDWDVLSYYARAETDRGGAYASEVYFLEVRPFREDILKLPGGEGGKAARTLGDLTALIQRQQHIIRQTYQHAARPPESPTQLAQDRSKLSEAELNLGAAARHLYAEMAATMENQAIGDALDNLAKAEKTLQGAGTALRQNALPEGQARERQGLAELVASRKSFQKAVTDNPSSFQDRPEDANPPTAEPARQLGEIAEFRDESKAAQDFLDKTRERQQALEQQAFSGGRAQFPRLAGEERQLGERLQAFQSQHPAVFRAPTAEMAQATNAMARAASSLQSRAVDSTAAMREASRRLEQLSQAVRNQSADRQLADAYRLKQMLDRQAATFDERARPDSRVSDARLLQATKDARETVNQLQRLAEQEPTREAFGQPLRDALSGDNKVELDARLILLQHAEGDDAKRERAGQAGESLRKVSRAFGESQPKATQMARQSDPLAPSGSDSLSLGLAELGSLARQLEDRRPVSKSDREKLGREALLNLQNGMRAVAGDNENAREVLGQLDRLLRADAGIDPGDLRKLMEQLQRFSVETSEIAGRPKEPPALSQIDPLRLPPAYRGRIQTYLQKLSEK